MPTTLPRVLIIGDSISIGYTPHVVTLLSGRAVVERNPGNAEDSGNILRNLDAWTAGDWDAIHLNCGLHDLKRPKTTGAFMVPLAEYERNLRTLFARLGARSKLVWATITPIIDERHAARPDFPFARHQRDVVAYSQVADRVVGELGLPVTDLNALVTRAGAERVLTEDGVHFPDEIYREMAQAVVRSLEPLLAGARSGR